MATMTLSLNQCHSLLLAEQSRDASVITAAVTDVLAANSETNLLEIEMAFRDAGSPVYLIAKPELTVVIGMLAWAQCARSPRHDTARKPVRVGGRSELRSVIGAAGLPPDGLRSGALRIADHPIKIKKSFNNHY